MNENLLSKKDVEYLANLSDEELGLWKPIGDEADEIDGILKDFE